MSNYRFIETCLFLPTYLNRKKLKQTLAGKSILITGASSGIGRQIAYKLANINCHLILVARRGELLAEVKQDLEMDNAKVEIFPADLRDEADLENLLQFLHQLPSGVDLVVNNAGHSIKRSIYESLDRYHDFTRTMAINYFAPVQLLLSLIPILQKNKGQIINISTVNAILAPVPYFAAYQASKSAFDVWLRSVAPELQEEGIATTTIYLPLVRTAMIQPTANYHKMPAMSVNHAAKIICKSMYTRKKKYKPWWIIFGQLASVFLRNLWDLSNTKKNGDRR